MTKLNNRKLRIAILTRPEYRSPRILAELLQKQLLPFASVNVFFEINLLNRLLTYRASKLNYQFWLRNKIKHYLSDRKIINQLKKCDAIILSECSPNSFWSNLYNVEKLRKITNKPVLLYEVYYLGNAPSQIDILKRSGNAGIGRYDWHLAVSDVTETRSVPGKGWSCTGLALSHSGLKPNSKKEFVALVDFRQDGYEIYHQQQIEVLKELNIKTIVLEGDYTTKKIRECYQAASIFFLQLPEAFGLPIAECLACGVQIFTASTAWPMSWRLDENPIMHAEGSLPNIFTVYGSREELKAKIIQTKENYDLVNSPFRIFDTFIQYYPHFYYGDEGEVKDVLQRIEERRFN